MASSVAAVSSFSVLSPASNYSFNRNQASSLPFRRANHIFRFQVTCAAKPETINKVTTEPLMRKPADHEVISQESKAADMVEIIGEEEDNSQTNINLAVKQIVAAIKRKFSTDNCHDLCCNIFLCVYVTVGTILQACEKFYLVWFQSTDEWYYMHTYTYI